MNRATARFIRFAAAAAFCVLVAASPAAAIDGEILIDQAKVIAGGITAGDAPGFPATLSRIGRYKLTGNLSAPVDEDAIEITASDVTLDLNGFTIGSDLPGSTRQGVLAPADANRVRIMSGTITGFGIYGILGLGTYYVVEDMRIVGNSIGMQLGGGSHVRNSTIANNSSIGMYCAACVIDGNLIAGNAFSGVTDTTKGGGLVLGNAIVGNGNYGLVAPNPPLPRTGYGNNILFGNNSGGLQVLGVTQLHPNVCEPACP